MKKIILLLVTLICGINLYSQNKNVIKDGVYEAFVVVKDSSQPTSKGKYLKVYVINDRVVEVRLKNGEIIKENSPNVKSYRFGKLNFSTNRFGELEGNAIIKVTKTNEDYLNISVDIEIPE